MNPANPELDKAMAIAASLRDAWGLRCVDDVALLAVWLIDQLNKLAEHTDADREFGVTVDDYCQDCPPIERRAMTAEGRCRRVDAQISAAPLARCYVEFGRWTVYGLVCDNPGITARQIAAALGFSVGPVRSTLHRLRAAGLVAVSKDRRRKRWYALATKGEM